MAKNEELTKMIDEIRYHEKINQSQIAEMAGVSPQHLSDVKNGRFPFTEELRTKLLEERTYLRNFEERIRNSAHQVPMEQGAEPYTTNSHGVRYMKREDGKLIIKVPIVPYYALASPDDEFLPERFGADTTTFEVDKIGRGKYYAFEVDGDSMDDGTRDSFQRGDIVLVRELDKDDWMPHLHISCWRFWVVCWGNNVRLKEIISQEGSVITLHSLNPSPEYCDFSLDLSQVSRLFNVIKHKPKERSFI